MKENRENKPVLKYLAVLLSLVLTGCGTIGLAQESTFESAYENGKEEEPAAPAYTSASRGVLISINTEDRSFVIHRTAEGDDIVLIHDGVRPLISEDLLSNSIKMVKEKGNAITVTPAS